ncbi:MAG: hypothetical protein ACC609_11475 [Methanobacterium formicicum]
MKNGIILVFTIRQGLHPPSERINSFGYKITDLKKKLSSGGAYKPRRIISPPKKDILNEFNGFLGD